VLVGVDVSLGGATSPILLQACLVFKVSSFVASSLCSLSTSPESSFIDCVSVDWNSAFARR